MLIKTALKIMTLVAKKGLTVRKRNLIIAFFAIFLTSQAHGYSLMHEYNYRSRNPVGSTAYMSQQAFGNRSYVENLTGELSPEIDSKNFRGFTLQAGLGLEHWRFLQTGITYTHLQSSSEKNRGTTLQGHEIGVESKVILSSPIFNISLGGAYFGVSKSLVSAGNYTQLTGSGYRVQGDCSYFFSPRLSWLVTALMQQEKLNNPTSQQIKSITLKSYRAGAGLSIWFL
jgi:hypothetical protein